MVDEVRAVMDEIAHVFGEDCPLCIQDGTAPIPDRHVHIFEWVPLATGGTVTDPERFTVGE